VRLAWYAREVVRSIYGVTDAQLAGQFGVDLQEESCPPEVRSPGRTIVRWRDQIAAWHQALVSNGPTEAINNRIKPRASTARPPGWRRCRPARRCVASPAAGRPGRGGAPG
jgi:hypothetical protein